MWCDEFFFRRCCCLFLPHLFSTSFCFCECMNDHLFCHCAVLHTPYVSSSLSPRCSFNFACDSVNLFHRIRVFHSYSYKPLQLQLQLLYIIRGKLTIFRHTHTHKKQFGMIATQLIVTSKNLQVTFKRRKFTTVLCNSWMAHIYLLQIFEFVVYLFHIHVTECRSIRNGIKWNNIHRWKNEYKKKNAGRNRETLNWKKIVLISRGHASRALRKRGAI